jgi:hypothetical protein
MAQNKNTTMTKISTSLPRSGPPLVLGGGGEDVVGVGDAVDPAWVFVAKPAGMAVLDVDAKQAVLCAIYGSES